MRNLIGAGLVLLAVVALVAEAAAPKSPPRPDVRAISARIDALVEADLARHDQKPNPLASDEVFLRRIYLDAIGRIPTVDEAVAFLHSTQADKRARLIDRLLDSPGYVSRQYNYWADVLRAKSRLRQGSGLPYIQFIKESLAANKPYDQFVRELLAAEGPSHARGNGATGYYLRDFNMPEDNMSNTVQVFLGTQMVCAQCHDHPFDKWTQLEFFEMVAFTGGTQTRYNQIYSSPKFQQVKAVMGDEADDREMKRAVGKFTEALRYGVEGSGTGLSRLPKDYQYDDAKPLELVKAHVMFGQQPSLSYPEPPKTKTKTKPGKSSRKSSRFKATPIDSRKTYAQWMTSPENPRFPQVVANRLWKQAMGRGVVEPVDDLKDSTKPANPELMAYLQGQMVALGYDMKQYLRAIYNSRTYQRQATATDIDLDQPYRFPGPLLARMNAEQMWDSMLTLIVPELDAYSLQNPRSSIKLATEKVYKQYEELMAMKPREIVDKSRLLAESYRLRVEVKSKKKSAQERSAAYKRMEEIKLALATKDEAKQLKLRPLFKQLSVARKKRDAKTIASLTSRMKALGYDPSAAMGSNKNYRYRNDYVRASEQVQQPARPGHFLREFGGSERELIEGANGDAAVTQALSLLNGFVAQNLLANPRAELTMAVAEAASLEQKIDRIYVATLARHPSDSEMSAARHHLRADEKTGCADLIWTLLNTHEFMFIQ